MATAIGYAPGALARYAGWHRVAAPCRDDGDSPFARLLGERWLFLPPATRRRFLRKIEAGACVSYLGEVAECRMSRVGRVLAQAARLIGAPLPLGTDVGVSASVSVTADADGQGQYWTRQYGRAQGFPQVIHSAKRFAGSTGIEEYLGLGVGIALRLQEAGGALLFVSDHYFLKLGGLRVRLPGWAMPGALTVGHIDIGGGRFVFSLDLVHPLLGELVHQLCVFADPAE
jgi:hypothetical protein